MSAGLPLGPQRSSAAPQVTQALGEGRAMRAYSFGQGFLNSASRQGFYDEVSGLMAKTYQLDEAILAFLDQQ